MTANEMYDDFQTEYDRVASSAAKGWDENEVAFFINQAQSDIRREWMNKTDNGKRQSYLFPFKKNVILNQYSDQSLTTDDSSVLFEMPEDYPGRSEKEIVTYTNCDFISSVTPVTDDEYFSMNIDETRSSSIEELRRMLTNAIGTNDQVFELFLPKVGNWSVKRYLVTYIREPRRVVIDLDNPDNQINSEYASDKHVEIVRRAVFYALEAAADSRLRTFGSKPMNYTQGGNSLN